MQNWTYSALTETASSLFNALFRGRRGIAGYIRGIAGYRRGIAAHILNPLNAELNPICHLLALLGTHHIFHINRIRVKLDFRLR